MSQKTHSRNIFINFSLRILPTTLAPASLLELDYVQDGFFDCWIKSCPFGSQGKDLPIQQVLSLCSVEFAKEVFHLLKREADYLAKLKRDLL